MSLNKRLQTLENATPLVVPYFHTLEEHPLNALEYFGVEGGREFHRQQGETETEFLQRCEQFAARHTQRGFLPIFFQIEMDGCGF